MITGVGSVAVVIDGADATVTLYDLLAVSDALSVALTVKLYVPEAVGVPLMTPVDVFKLKPVGSAPEEIAKEMDGVPPDV